MFNKGIGHVVIYGDSPSSEGLPDNLDDFFKNYFIDFYGQKVSIDQVERYWERRRWPGWKSEEPYASVSFEFAFKRLYETKISIPSELRFIHLQEERFLSTCQTSNWCIIDSFDS